MYYKNKENQPYFEPSQAIIKRDGLIKITKEEFNQIVYEINNPPITEVQRVQSINNKTESIITKPYPIYKQLNIRGLLNPYTNQDIEVMDMFIDSVRGIGRNAKDTGLTVDQINWGGLDEYTNHDEILKDATQIREKLGL